MKILIAVVNCHKRLAYQQAIRDTWLPLVSGADVRFFLGPSEREPKPDEVFLDCDDSYQGLPSKVRGIVRWAYEHGYDYVLKCDDDVILDSEKMLASDFTGYDFVGRGNDTRTYPVPLGFCYWLSKKAMALLIDAELPNNNNDEVWVASNLAKGNIVLHNDDRYCLHRGNRNDFIDPVKRPLRVPPRIVTRNNKNLQQAGGTFAWCLYITWLGYRELPQEANIEEFYRLWKRVGNGK